MDNEPERRAFLSDYIRLVLQASPNAGVMEWVQALDHANAQRDYSQFRRLLQDIKQAVAADRRQPSPGVYFSSRTPKANFRRNGVIGIKRLLVINDLQLGMHTCYWESYTHGKPERSASGPFGILSSSNMECQ